MVSLLHTSTQHYHRSQTSSSVESDYNAKHIRQVSPGLYFCVCISLLKNYIVRKEDPSHVLRIQPRPSTTVTNWLTANSCEGSSQIHWMQQNVHVNHYAILNRK